MKNDLNNESCIQSLGTDITYDIEQLPDITSGNVIGVNMQGLGVCTAAIFIVGEIAGAGVLALPGAVNGTGWIGAVIITVVCFVSIYTGTLLGKSWLLVQQRYPEYRSSVRYPYPAIGQAAYGKKGRLAVSICINVTLYGATCVFMIMAAQNLHDLLSHHIQVPFCYWLLIVAALLIPATWLGTPKDFWFFAVAAMIATIIACILLMADMVIAVPESRTPRFDSPSFTSFGSAFGTILFAFGGHPAFPTFQTDMKVQKQFGYAVGIAYMCILALYMPIALTGYSVFGSNISENILLTLPKGTILILIESLITCHLLFAYVIVINPVCQDVEEKLNIPSNFTWKRVVCRTFLVGFSLLITETVPKFGAILSLVGGSTTNILAYVLPMIFYMKLCRMDGDWNPIYIPLHVKVLNYEIMIVGILGGVASTYAAIKSLTSPNSLTVPCFLNITSQ